MIAALRDWQDLVGAAVGGILAFAAAFLILYIERSQSRRIAMRQVSAAIRAYRSAAVPLLRNIFTTKDPKVAPGLHEIVAALRFAPTIGDQFSSAAASLLQI